MAKAYYKILKEGRSCNGGKLTWSLPKNRKPGDWHEVAGDLERCKNGLHLTSEPTYYRDPGKSCYLAEIEGETVGPYGDELVCRKIRLVRFVPWKELVPDGDGAKPEPPAKTERSPAYRLLAHVWKHEGDGMGKSWARINDAMQMALKLAITSGMKFDPEDFASFSKDFNSGYWIGDGEHYYAMACARDRQHGANASAYQSYEHWRGRKPFIVAEEAREGATRIRLCVGQRFDWHIKLKTEAKVIVTSFDDHATQPCLIACSYKDAARSKIDKRFKITHEDIVNYHAAIREASKAKVKAGAETEPQPV
jgi:hypothetical protein